ncbi:MAG: hypothetical protein IT436_13060 [Phycisphaerales bacterium]|nr:hypothetical protein [Phycisphaerales bacterium]
MSRSKLEENKPPSIMPPKSTVRPRTLSYAAPIPERGFGIATSHRAHGWARAGDADRPMTANAKSRAAHFRMLLPNIMYSFRNPREMDVPTAGAPVRARLGGCMLC